MLWLLRLAWDIHEVIDLLKTKYSDKIDGDLEKDLRQIFAAAHQAYYLPPEFQARVKRLHETVEQAKQKVEAGEDAFLVLYPLLVSLADTLIQLVAVLNQEDLGA